MTRKYGTKSTDRKEIVCNPYPVNKFRFVTSSTTSVVSNWSEAEEINRLAKNDKVMDVEADYCFHRDGCISQGLTPFKHPHYFHSRGKNAANSHLNNVEEDTLLYKEDHLC